MRSLYIIALCAVVAICAGRHIDNTYLPSKDDTLPAKAGENADFLSLPPIGQNQNDGFVRGGPFGFKSQDAIDGSQGNDQGGNGGQSEPEEAEYQDFDQERYGGKYGFGSSETDTRFNNAESYNQDGQVGVSGLAKFLNLDYKLENNRGQNKFGGTGYSSGFDKSQLYNQIEQDGKLELRESGHQSHTQKEDFGLSGTGSSEMGFHKSQSNNMEEQSGQSEYASSVTDAGYKKSQGYNKERQDDSKQFDLLQKLQFKSQKAHHLGGVANDLEALIQDVVSKQKHDMPIITNSTNNDESKNSENDLSDFNKNREGDKNDITEPSLPQKGENLGGIANDLEILIQEAVKNQKHDMPIMASKNNTNVIKISENDLADSDDHEQGGKNEISKPTLLEKVQSNGSNEDQEGDNNDISEPSSPLKAENLGVISNDLETLIQDVMHYQIHENPIILSNSNNNGSKILGNKFADSDEYKQGGNEISKFSLSQKSQSQDSNKNNSTENKQSDSNEYQEGDSNDVSEPSLSLKTENLGGISNDLESLLEEMVSDQRFDIPIIFNKHNNNGSKTIENELADSQENKEDDKTNIYEPYLSQIIQSHIFNENKSSEDQQSDSNEYQEGDNNDISEPSLSKEAKSQSKNGNKTSEKKLSDLDDYRHSGSSEIFDSSLSQKAQNLSGVAQGLDALIQEVANNQIHDIPSIAKNNNKHGSKTLENELTDSDEYLQGAKNDISKLAVSQKAQSLSGVADGFEIFIQDVVINQKNDIPIIDNRNNINGSESSGNELPDSSEYHQGGNNEISESSSSQEANGKSGDGNKTSEFELTDLDEIQHGGNSEISNSSLSQKALSQGGVANGFEVLIQDVVINQKNDIPIIANRNNINGSESSGNELPDSSEYHQGGNNEISESSSSQEANGKSGDGNKTSEFELTDLDEIQHGGNSEISNSSLSQKALSQGGVANGFEVLIQDVVINQKNDIPIIANRNNINGSESSGNELPDSSEYHQGGNNEISESSSSQEANGKSGDGNKTSEIELSDLDEIQHGGNSEISNSPLSQKAQSLGGVANGFEVLIQDVVINQKNDIPIIANRNNINGSESSGNELPDSSEYHQGGNNEISESSSSQEANGKSGDGNKTSEFELTDLDEIQHGGNSEISNSSLSQKALSQGGVANGFEVLIQDVVINQKNDIPIIANRNNINGSESSGNELPDSSEYHQGGNNEISESSSSQEANGKSGDGNKTSEIELSDLDEIQHGGNSEISNSPLSQKAQSLGGVANGFEVLIQDVVINQKNDIPIIDNRNNINGSESSGNELPDSSEYHQGGNNEISESSSSQEANGKSGDGNKTSEIELTDLDEIQHGGNSEISNSPLSQKAQSLGGVANDFETLIQEVVNYETHDSPIILNQINNNKIKSSDIELSYSNEYRPDFKSDTSEPLVSQKAQNFEGAANDLEALIENVVNNQRYNIPIIADNIDNNGSKTSENELTDSDEYHQGGKSEISNPSLSQETDNQGQGGNKSMENDDSDSKGHQQDGKKEITELSLSHKLQSLGRVVNGSEVLIQEMVNNQILDMPIIVNNNYKDESKRQKNSENELSNSNEYQEGDNNDISEPSLSQKTVNIGGATDDLEAIKQEVVTNLRYDIPIIINKNNDNESKTIDNDLANSDEYQQDQKNKISEPSLSQKAQSHDSNENKSSENKQSDSNEYQKSDNNDISEPSLSQEANSIGLNENKNSENEQSDFNGHQQGGIYEISGLPLSQKAQSLGGIVDDLEALVQEVVNNQRHEFPIIAIDNYNNGSKGSESELSNSNEYKPNNKSESSEPSLPQKAHSRGIDGNKSLDNHSDLGGVADGFDVLIQDVVNNQKNDIPIIANRNNNNGSEISEIELSDSSEYQHGGNSEISEDSMPQKANSQDANGNKSSENIPSDSNGHQEGSNSESPLPQKAHSQDVGANDLEALIHDMRNYQQHNIRNIAKNKKKSGNKISVNEHFDSNQYQQDGNSGILKPSLSQKAHNQGVVANDLEALIHNMRNYKQNDIPNISSTKKNSGNNVLGNEHYKSNEYQQDGNSDILKPFSSHKAQGVDSINLKALIHDMHHYKHQNIPNVSLNNKNNGNKILGNEDSDSNEYEQSGNPAIFKQSLSQEVNGHGDDEDDSSENEYFDSNEYNHGGNSDDLGALIQQLLNNQRQDMPTLAFNNKNSGDGSYSYKYSTKNGNKVEEHGYLHGAVPVVQGGYSFTDTDGVEYSVTYTADENGYRPQGAHLPTPPPIPEEILKSIELNTSEYSDDGDDGSYRPEHHYAAYTSSDYRSIRSRGPPSPSSFSRTQKRYKLKGKK